MPGASTEAPPAWCVLTPRRIVGFHRVPRESSLRARESGLVDAHVEELAILAALACLFVVTHYVVSARIARQRELESRLEAARAEISALRARLTDATRPPTQFARMRVRQVAMNRFARLSLATPRRSRLATVERIRDRTH